MKHVADYRKIIQKVAYRTKIIFSTYCLTTYMQFRNIISDFNLLEPTMRLPLLVSSLSIVGLAQAGQFPLGVEIRTDSCTRSENDSLIKLSRELSGTEYAPETCGTENAGKALLSDPWTSTPQCMPEQNSTSTYCIYANDKFANGRGISFLTSPSIAERIALLPAFTKKNLYNKVNQFDDPPWEVKAIPGRGKGLFASRTLHRGDEIVSSTPVGAFQSDALMPDYALDYIYLHTAFIHLPKATQQLFLSTMAGSAGDPIMERLNTNAFSGEFEGSSHFLMYPETAVRLIIQQQKMRLS